MPLNKEITIVIGRVKTKFVYTAHPAVSVSRAVIKEMSVTIDEMI